MPTTHAQQPHPLHDPDARRTYMLAEIVRAFGLTFGMVAAAKAVDKLVAGARRPSERNARS